MLKLSFPPAKRMHTSALYSSSDEFVLVFIPASALVVPRFRIEDSKVVEPIAAQEAFPTNCLRFKVDLPLFDVFMFVFSKDELKN